MGVDLMNEPLGEDSDGEPVYLRDLWPTQREVQDTIADAVQSDMFRKSYANVYAGDERWNGLRIPAGDLYDWGVSTYVKRPPYFEGMDREPEPLEAITGARVLALLGDSVTTDHISPAGSIKADSPAGRYLLEHGVERRDFNSYGSRRGNHEVMVRGTFANVRLRNRLAPGTEGSWTVHIPSGEQMSIYDAAMRYIEDHVPLIVLAGKEYGSGSSRDWAAKGPKLLGVRAVIAESYERIHRSNLVGMGILPLQFAAGESADALGLGGEESFDVADIGEETAREASVTARDPAGGEQTFRATVRIDTPQEWLYFRHGGILQYVLRQLVAT
jgi:aconitate hydratase